MLIIFPPMRYLAKKSDSLIEAEAWRYSTKSHRHKIRKQLLLEQSSFCAYSERYIEPVDACEIEHFDDRKKNTLADNYWNWYAVHRWSNQRKRSIREFLPILMPYDPSLAERIQYSLGAFRAVDINDIEAVNLISFLGWNDPTLATYRQKFVARLRDFQQRFFAEDPQGFQEYLLSNPENLSFRTVLEAELNLIFECRNI